MSTSTFAVLSLLQLLLALCSYTGWNGFATAWLVVACYAYALDNNTEATGASLEQQAIGLTLGPVSSVVVGLGSPATEAHGPASYTVSAADVTDIINHDQLQSGLDHAATKHSKLAVISSQVSSPWPRSESLPAGYCWDSASSSPRLPIIDEQCSYRAGSPVLKCRTTPRTLHHSVSFPCRGRFSDPCIASTSPPLPSPQDSPLARRLWSERDAEGVPLAKDLLHLLQAGRTLSQQQQQEQQPEWRWPNRTSCPGRC
jgi:hypothetical protein